MTNKNKEALAEIAARILLCNSALLDPKQHGSKLAGVIPQNVSILCSVLGLSSVEVNNKVVELAPDFARIHLNDGAALAATS